VRHQPRAVVPVLLTIAALALTVSPASAADPKPLWQDEFDKDGPPDPAKWDFERGFVRNEELQWYQPENAVCRGGFLVIEARREKKPNPGYKSGGKGFQGRESIEVTSACLITKGKREFQYGRFEMRARIDTRLGSWPAFWTLGVKNEWPSNGEIDIMEYYRNMLLANVAWGTDQRWKAKWDDTRTPLEKLGGADWSKQFHVWRMDWDEEAIRLSVDDKLLNETLQKDAVNPDGFSPFKQPHYLLLNQAIGGASGGDPSKLEYPVRFEVDWVRVYPAE
jgi:beta-glucanase (GH16 family)